MKKRKEVREGGGGGRGGKAPWKCCVQGRPESKETYSLWLRVLMLLVRTIMFAV